MEILGTDVVLNTQMDFRECLELYFTQYDYDGPLHRINKIY